MKPIDLDARVDDVHRAVLAAIPPRAINLTDIAAGRRQFDELFGSLPTPPLPESVAIDTVTTSSADGSEVSVRLYRSENTGRSAPGLLWIHGGGMVLGDAEMDDPRCCRFADELGIVVASVDYRLAPEHPYPTPVDDCFAGLTWLANNAESLGVDPTRIAIGGASAGGGLAAGTALLARDQDGPDLCFQFLVYPMIDDRNETPSSHAVTDSRVWNRETNLAGWNAYLNGRAGADDIPIYAAPARADDLGGLPPAYINVGDLDLFLDENVDYATRLLRAGVPTELHVYPGAFHGSNSLVVESELSQRWRADEHAALRRALSGG